MKFLIAADSFKGSLTSMEAAECMQEWIRRVFPDADIRMMPAADGGELLRLVIDRLTEKQRQKTKACRKQHHKRRKPPAIVPPNCFRMELSEWNQPEPAKFRRWGRLWKLPDTAKEQPEREHRFPHPKNFRPF